MRASNRFASLSEEEPGESKRARKRAAETAALSEGVRQARDAALAREHAFASAALAASSGAAAAANLGAAASATSGAAASASSGAAAAASSSAAANLYRRPTQPPLPSSPPRAPSYASVASARAEPLPLRPPAPPPRWSAVEEFPALLPPSPRSPSLPLGLRRPLPRALSEREARDAARAAAEAPLAAHREEIKRALEAVRALEESGASPAQLSPARARLLALFSAGPQDERFAAEPLPAPPSPSSQPSPASPGRGVVTLSASIRQQRPAPAVCGIPSHVSSGGPPEPVGRIVSGLLGDKLSHVDGRVQDFMARTCWSFSRERGHIMFKRCFFTPHGACTACSASAQPCADHTHTQTIGVASSPSDSRSTPNQLAGLRSMELEMHAAGGVCAVCRSVVQGEDPVLRHYHLAAAVAVMGGT